ncbi:NAD-dependent epimerase/dehydratase family protein [Actinoplanes sp. NPDC026619]|uniref:NAD-dependent epimerase/dehydratase family protein n=1 Tax=Actinoplanes sp. NPDC026619 TaxID=3155798 RepID=UPI0034093E93
MRLLILGGSGFVGRAIAEEAVARGDDVTVFNRGQRGVPPGVRVLRGDRLAPDGLAALNVDQSWDAVVDTWSAGSGPVGRTARLLSGRAAHYTYVSSRSVYQWGATLPLTELTPLADPREPGYAGDKLRGENAAEAFDGPVLLARAGLILGPYEDVGRLPWWLSRVERGGPTLAPGPRELPLQYIDARDLAIFILNAGGAQLPGAYNLVSGAGHTTMGELLGLCNEVTGNRALLRWTDPSVIEAAGIEPWTQLPIWFPPGPDHEFLHQADVTKAFGAGLRCRPARDTVTDTWRWMRSLRGDVPLRADRSPVGLDPAIERKVLGE